MFDEELYKLDTTAVPSAIKYIPVLVQVVIQCFKLLWILRLLSVFFFYRCYEELRVKHEPLQLITPQFETPLPPLQPAVSTFVFINILFVSLPSTYLIEEWLTDWRANEAYAAQLSLLLLLLFLLYVICHV